MAQLVNVAHRGMVEQMASHDLNSLEFAIPRAFLDQDEWTTTQPTQVLSVKASRKSCLANKLVETFPLTTTSRITAAVLADTPAEPTTPAATN